MPSITDNQLIDIFATQLEAASAQAGWNYVVLQNNQPSLEGAPTAPTIYFEKMFDDEYGWPMVGYVHNAPVAPSPQGTYTQAEDQWTETTFQVSAQAIQDPSNLSVPTASDIVNYMKLYINSRKALAAFKSAGVGVLRVTKIRNPKFKDDREVFEANPNFDVVVQYKREISATVPATNIVQGAKVSGVSGQGLFPVIDSAGETVA